MTQDELIDMLWRWGLIKTWDDDRLEDEIARKHVIERTRKFAPMTRKKAEKKLVGRDGTDRRRIMARAAAIRGMGISPKWASDPIRAPANQGGGGGETRSRIQMPPELAWVDSALVQLGKKARILEIVVRVEYTAEGIQSERATEARRLYGGTLTYWQYRKQLDRAHALLEGFRMATAA